MSRFPQIKRKSDTHDNLFKKRHETENALGCNLNELAESCIMLKDSTMGQAMQFITGHRRDILFVHSLNIEVVLRAEKNGRYDSYEHSRGKILRHMGLRDLVWGDPSWKSIYIVLHKRDEYSDCGHWSLLCYFKSTGNLYHYDSLKGTNRDICTAFFKIALQWIVIFLTTLKMIVID